MAKVDISRRGVIAAAGCALGAAGLTGCDWLGGGKVPHAETPELSDRPGQGSHEGDSGKDPEPTLVERTLARMTLEQKVAQLFVVTPEQLTGVSQATAAGQMTHDALAQYPVGGLCYFAQNITGEQQLLDMLEATAAYGAQVGAGVSPLLTIDEEGGPLVARVANSGFFAVERFSNMADVGASGDVTHAARVGSAIGTYLREIGFNVDFAPVADVLTNPANTVIGPRSFGSDPQLVANMVVAEVEAMHKTGVVPCVKHFPGHGDTAGDSHTGAVYATRSRADIEACEFLPFKAAIDAGCPMVMVGHIETPNFAADGLPASLSKVMMTDVLRGQLGFGGVIVSDSFAMGAITESFHPADAATRFFQAGGDCLLMPQSLPDAYEGVLSAVRSGTISEGRIDGSVTRILQAKFDAGILTE